MKPISNTLAALVILIMTLGGSAAMGAITASLDRDRVALGDTLRLTIIATENEKLKDADLRDLTERFRNHRTLNQQQHQHRQWPHVSNSKSHYRSHAETCGQLIRPFDSYGTE